MKVLVGNPTKRSHRLHPGSVKEMVTALPLAFHPEGTSSLVPLQRLFERMQGVGHFPAAHPVGDARHHHFRGRGGQLGRDNTKSQLTLLEAKLPPEVHRKIIDIQQRLLARSLHLITKGEAFLVQGKDPVHHLLDPENMALDGLDGRLLHHFRPIQRHGIGKGGDTTSQHLRIQPHRLVTHIIRHRIVESLGTLLGGDHVAIPGPSRGVWGKFLALMVPIVGELGDMGIALRGLRRGGRFHSQPRFHAVDAKEIKDRIGIRMPFVGVGVGQAQGHGHRSLPVKKDAVLRIEHTVVGAGHLDGDLGQVIVTGIRIRLGKRLRHIAKEPDPSWIDLSDRQTCRLQGGTVDGIHAVSEHPHLVPGAIAQDRLFRPLRPKRHRQQSRQKKE